MILFQKGRINSIYYLWYHMICQLKKGIWHFGKEGTGTLKCTGSLKSLKIPCPNLRQQTAQVSKCALGIPGDVLSQYWADGTICHVVCNWHNHLLWICNEFYMCSRIF